MKKGPRINVRRRTRKALLHAAGEFLKDGSAPTMEGVAQRAGVSRATAYRYFPSLEALLCEAPLDRSVSDPEELFARSTSEDPELRIEQVEEMLHGVISANEMQLRAMLANSLKHSLERGGKAEIPIRQNRRTGLIRAALQPVRKHLDKNSWDNLCAGLALILGTESMLVFRDVLGMDEPRARGVRRWAARSLVRAALTDSARRDAAND